MRRREFITIVGGAAVAWPVVARAQQERGKKLVAVLWSASENSANLVRQEAFQQAMQKLHWDEGRNVEFVIRWGGGELQIVRKQAEELVALAPDVVVGIGSFATGALRDATRSVPIVFHAVPDPVAAGYVANLAHPGGNATGFVFMEYGVSGKWPGLLQAGGTRHQTRGSVARSRNCLRNRAVGGDPGGRLVAGSGSHSAWNGRCR